VVANSRRRSWPRPSRRSWRFMAAMLRSVVALGCCPVSDGVLLRGQPEGVITKRMEHIVPCHPQIAGIDIGGNVAQWMTHVQARAARVREHVHDHELRAVGKPGRNPPPAAQPGWGCRTSRPPPSDPASAARSRSPAVRCNGTEADHHVSHTGTSPIHPGHTPTRLPGTVSTSSPAPRHDCCYAENPSHRRAAAMAKVSTRRFEKQSSRSHETYRNAGHHARPAVGRRVFSPNNHPECPARRPRRLPLEAV